MNKFSAQILFFALSSIFSLQSHALQIFRTGSTNDLSVRIDSITYCLAGGGSDYRWGEGWRQLLNSINMGDVLIIRADGKRGGYEDWLYDDYESVGLPKINSVTTLLLENSSDANSAEAIELVNNAELIFFAGGDQSLYFEWLNHSDLKTAIEKKIEDKTASIGGTSAGSAFLAGIGFTSKYPSFTNTLNGHVTSEDALKYTTDKMIDLENGFLSLPWLKNTITETHTSERNRQGRLIGFMAKAVHNNYSDVSAETIKGIAIDSHTAYCFDPNGFGKVYGDGNVFFTQGRAPIETIEPNRNLHWKAQSDAIIAYIINSATRNNFFNLANWSGYGGDFENWWIDGESAETPFLGTTPK